uniref:Ras-associating domain-containing protein n=1 Tax=Gouania willdenowi TaxID=441366 RepID=A0A8C5EPV8_GOUWI
DAPPGRGQSDEGKVSVWVCREEKLVSGLTKRTTCSDVVKVLLEDQNLQQSVSAAMLSGPPHSYCVVEKWRGFERILPNKTKILRLWSAWGDEQENVRFVLVKNEASLPNNGPRSAEARVGTGRSGWAAVAAAASLSQEKQRRIVRKAFRKLDKMNKKKEQVNVSKDNKGSVEKMETLVHLVISQDHTIRQQVHRIKELDREIERYEAKVHFDRIKRHGVNYVQDTYRVDCSPEAGVSPGDCKRKAERQDAWRTAEETSSEVDQDQDQDSDSTAEETTLDPDVRSLSENELAMEEERIKTQLDTSLYIGLRLKTDLDAIRGDLDLSLALWETKESELLDLLARVETMELEQASKQVTEVGAGGSEAEPASVEKGGGWVEQARGLSKACNTNDEDSDTGLSSMHSQDSDNPETSVGQHLKNRLQQ